MPFNRDSERSLSSPDTSAESFIKRTTFPFVSRSPRRRPDARGGERDAMIQTLAFRNINIFFLIQTYGSYIYTVQKIILRPARPVVHNCYDWGRPVVAGGDAGGGKGWVARNSFLFSLFLSLWGGGGGGGYTHILREVEGLYIVF